MNKERNLFDLVDIISSHTELDPNLVRGFVNQLFKEIEKELLISSYVKIDGLGIFRIIRSVSSDRLLFLGKFNSVDEAKQIVIADDSGSTESSIKGDNITYGEVTSESKFEDNYLSTGVAPGEHTSTEVDDENLHFNFSKEPVLAGGGTIDKKDEINDYLFEYESHEKEESKRKKLSKIRIVTLLIATVLGVIFLLILLYPKEDRGDGILLTDSRMPQIRNYLEIENEDTVNYAHVILAESDLDFLLLSQIYYGHDIFWSYIYKANENEVDNPFEIATGTIIKIPKLSSELIDKNNKHSVDSARTLANKIFKLRDSTNP